MVASLENSLRLLGTDYVDVFQLHGVLPSEYGYAIDKLGPALREQKAKGKIRHIGITEQPVEDFSHEMLLRAAQDDGVVRPDVDFMDVAKMVGNIASIVADDEQKARILEVSLDGLRYRG